MRLGRKLSEGFAVDHEAEARPAPVADRAEEIERPVPMAVEPDHFAGTGAPVVSGQPPVG